jgi:hypothetical protein
MAGRVHWLARAGKEFLKPETLYSCAYIRTNVNPTIIGCPGGRRPRRFRLSRTASQRDAAHRNKRSATVCTTVTVRFRFAPRPDVSGRFYLIINVRTTRRRTCTGNCVRRELLFAPRNLCTRRNPIRGFERDETSKRRFSMRTPTPGLNSSTRNITYAPTLYG